MASKNQVPAFLYDREQRKIKSANKTLKRHRDVRPPRRKDWIEVMDDEDNLTGVERVMPRGEQERRQKVTEKAYQLDRSDGVENPIIEGLQGQVIEVSTGLCRVRLPDRTILCHLRGSLSAYDTGFTNVVAVGDQVVISDGNPGVIEQVLPRHNQLARVDGHLQQVIAANLDQLLIVAAWRDPILWAELIDRYLITAERHAITPIIAVNKIDLADSEAAVMAYMQPYRDLGYEIILTSAQTGRGIPELRAALEGEVTVLAGMSGVGKSSLLSAVEPGFKLRISDVSEFWGEGQHTTTQVTMLPLGQHGYVIDTPGIREFGLAGLHRADLLAFYPEFHDLNCRFANCTHQHEPGCAVIPAVKAGRLSEVRYHNYSVILADLPE